MRNFNHEIKGLVFNFIFIIANLLIVINFNNKVFLASALLFALAAVTFVKWKTYQTIVIIRVTIDFFTTIVGFRAFVMCGNTRMNNTRSRNGKIFLNHIL